ncbi:recombinase family protein [Pseudomonas xanthosomatis]|uniref:recombinase family protein n=1 Tax=Pseudomonas xanthosomatis TaxID=2842356 RepID=UPI001C3CE07E|nr:recombinase family protein [Pseudomonas xanthosomatis]QXH45380.1 recombinase family protein [Pseudomonas xanthosomatis]
MKVIAYYRVSTKSQGESGLGIEAQHDYIAVAAEQNDWEVIAEYTDTISGSVAPAERPECAKAIAACKEHDAILVVAKLDRLSRDVEHIAGMMKRNNFKVATMPHATTVELHIHAMLAEQERTFISERTKAALKALQQRADKGCVESQAKIARRNAAPVEARRNATGKDGAATQANVKKATTHAAMVLPHIKECLFDNCTTLRSVAECLNAKGVTTSRGGEWSATAVMRVMTALNLSFKKAA